MAIFVHIIKLINAFETFKLSPERVCVGREYHIHKDILFLFFFFFPHVETLRPYPLELPGVLFHFHFSTYPYLCKFIILALSIKDFTLESLDYFFSQHGKNQWLEALYHSVSQIITSRIYPQLALRPLGSLFFFITSANYVSTEIWKLKETLFSKDSRLGITMTYPLFVRK